jgi:hypothetical protein
MRNGEKIFTPRRLLICLKNDPQSDIELAKCVYKSVYVNACVCVNQFK